MRTLSVELGVRSEELDRRFIGIPRRGPLEAAGGVPLAIPTGIVPPVGRIYPRRGPLEAAGGVPLAIPTCVVPPVGRIILSGVGDMDW